MNSADVTVLHLVLSPKIQMSISPSALFWETGEDSNVKEFKVNFKGVDNLAIRKIDLSNPNFILSILPEGANSARLLIKPISTAKEIAGTVIIFVNVPESNPAYYYAYCYVMKAAK